VLVRCLTFGNEKKSAFRIFFVFIPHSACNIPKPKINLPPITNHDERYTVEGAAVLGHGFEGMLGLAQWLSKFVQFVNNAPPRKSR
jgi:hypothetical protein